MNKQTQVVMFSSKTGQWATPQEFYDKLDWRFGPFNLDPCADSENAKCTKFFTKGDDGLSQSWHQYVMKADEIHFVKGRLKFGDSENSAPFPSAVVVFDGCNQRQIFGAMNR